VKYKFGILPYKIAYGPEVISFNPPGSGPKNRGQQAKPRSADAARYMDLYIPLEFLSSFFGRIFGAPRQKPGFPLLLKGYHRVRPPGDTLLIPLQSLALGTPALRAAFPPIFIQIREKNSKKH
jgi:hypothetical protein